MTSNDPALVKEELRDLKNPCNKIYNHPVKFIELSSNLKNLAEVPFNVENVHLNIYCHDADVLDDIQINLRITS